MKYVLIIDQSAEDDLKEVFDFYEYASPGKGEQSCVTQLDSYAVKHKL